MTGQLDLTAEHRQLVAELLRAYLPGVEVWAYGSRVSGTARPYSDLDLALFTDSRHAAAIADLRDAFEDSDLPFRVDLLRWEQLPATFQEHIRGCHLVLQEGPHHRD